MELLSFFAEREGFEPPEPLSSTVFKTAAIDHSAISPLLIEQIWCANLTDYRTLIDSLQAFIEFIDWLKSYV